MNSLPLTLVILTNNSEINLSKIVDFWKYFSEVIIVDDQSTDNTEKIAKNFGAKFISRKLSGDFASQRNITLTIAKNSWVLFLDDDEQIGLNFIDELNSIDWENTPYSAFKIKRVDMFLGQKLTHGEVWQASHDGIIRLVKKSVGEFVGPVHETFVTSEKVGRLKSSIIHFAHESISSFLQKINLYSTLRAQELLSAKKKVFITSLFFYPLAKFIYSYFLLLGFLDKEAGFIYSFLMSFHSFLVRAKLLVKTSD